MKNTEVHKGILVFVEPIARAKGGENNKLNYEEKWKVLADFLIEIRKEGEKIPTDVMSDLRSAKTMIQVLKADPTNTKDISRIEKYLRSVESYAINTAEKQGTEKVVEWLKKLETGKRGRSEEEKEAISKFVPGFPRDKKWVRIQISEDTPPKDIKKLVKTSNLSYKIQKKGYILVYGNDENIKSFMKKMTERFRVSRNV